MSQVNAQKETFVHGEIIRWKRCTITVEQRCPLMRVVDLLITVTGVSTRGKAELIQRKLRKHLHRK